MNRGMGIVVTVVAVIIIVPVMAIGLLYGNGGSPYVTGHFTCASPMTGAPDYCEMLSDDTYVVVPWSVYSTASYGSVLSYSGSSWTVLRGSQSRTGPIPDVSYSSWRMAKRVTSISSYSGMSSLNKGVTVYKTSGSYTARSSFGRK